MSRTWLWLGLRLGVGGLFAYAAVTKVPAFDAFAEEVANYRLLPAMLVPFFAAALPGIELLAGVLVMANRGVRPAAILLCGLLLVFIGALSQSLLRGINLTCGCFGGAEVATWGTVARDVLILLPTALLAWRGSVSRALTPMNAGDRT